MRTHFAGFAVLVAAAASPAMGQAPQQVLPTEQFQPDQPVLRFDVGGNIEYHSNLLKLDDGVDPTSLYGSSKRSDFMISGFAGAAFDREYSLQRFRADARVEPTKFLEYSQFDFVGYNAGFNWDWAVGRALFGTAGLRFKRNLSYFLNGTQLNGEVNLESRQNYYATGGLRLTPNWALIAGADYLVLDNSATRVNYADYRFTSYEMGVQFAPGTGTEVGFVYRRTNGDYPNRQIQDSLGQIISTTGIDNAFTQDAYLARLQIRPSDDSRIAGEIGYTSRKFDQVPDRDFSGITAGLNLDWRPTGATTVQVALIRGLLSQDLLTGSFVDETTLRVTPSTILTGKLTLTGLLAYSIRSFQGEQGVASGAASDREDKLTTIGAELGYAYARNITLTAGLRNENRSSSVSGLDFTDNIVTFGVKATF